MSRSYNTIFNWTNTGQAGDKYPILGAFESSKGDQILVEAIFFLQTKFFLQSILTLFNSTYRNALNGGNFTIGHSNFNLDYFTDADCFELIDLWSCFLVHSELSAPSKEEHLERLNSALELLNESIANTMPEIIRQQKQIDRKGLRGTSQGNGSAGRTR